MEFDRDELMPTFLAETDEHLAQMEQALVGLETHPDDGEQLAVVFRGAHTMKGNAAVLDLRPVEELAHVVEGLLDRLRDGSVALTGGLVSLLLAAVDAFREMVPQALGGDLDMHVEHRALADRLRAATAATASAGAAGAGPDVVCAPLEERTRTLRVDVSKLDRMLDLTGEAAVARGRLLRDLELLGLVGASALESAREMDRLCHGLQELVMSARMVPIGPTFRRQARTVRDLATETSRQVRLVLEGEDVEVDTAVVERLADPLMHMVRNAVDHGVEAPDVRAAAGKDPCGTITLRAFHDAGTLVVTVADDGAGLDRARILARARERGLVGSAPADAEIDRLIFEPGFTTADHVTTVSGRGVGMDVVRRNIEALRGSISIDSRSGLGTTLTIRLPLTLAIIDGLSVGVGGETYILPIESVVECLELPASERRASEAAGVVAVRGRMLPYVRLRHRFEVPPTEEAAPREYVVVVRQGAALAGLAVDVLHGESQAVLKPLDRFFAHLPGISGSTILGDGRVALVLDVALLLESVAASAEPAA
jgi:two-component system chemotaxis sensor kinase CheA